MELMAFVIAIVAVAVGVVCGYFGARTRTVAAETLLAQRGEENEKIKAELAASRSEGASLREENTSLRTENARLDEQLRQQAEERKALRSESEMIFREIANSIFDEKSKVMRENNRTQLGDILTPFKSDLENLKKTINDCYIGEMSEVKSLKEQVKDLTDLNNTIGRFEEIYQTVIDSKNSSS